MAEVQKTYPFLTLTNVGRYLAIGLLDDASALIVEAGRRIETRKQSRALLIEWLERKLLTELALALGCKYTSEGIDPEMITPIREHCATPLDQGPMFREGHTPSLKEKALERTMRTLKKAAIKAELTQFKRAWKKQGQEPKPLMSPPK